MQVKKFEAPTIQEALETIKRELGPEAIILQTKQNRKGFGLMSKSSVEVTAAVSERSLLKKQAVELRLPEVNRESLKKLPASRQAEILDHYAGRVRSAANPKVTETRYIDIVDSEQVPQVSPDRMGFAGMSVEEEVRQLKRMIEEIKSTQEQTASGAQALMPSQGAMDTPALHGVFEQMILNGVDKRYAYPLIKKASFELGSDRSKDPDAVLDQVASEIVASVSVNSPLAALQPGRQEKGPVVLALVGPTGVGKTTTVAKIASEAILKRNLRVGLINLDSYKVGAFEQLGTYSKILKVPFRSVSSVDDLNAALQDFQSMDLVIVDTTGRSQRDPESLNQMKEILQVIPSLQSCLVLSATTRDTELYDMAHRFSLFRPNGIIFSKLDEANVYGSIYNLAQRAKLPLFYFTTGQRVPEDIEEATPERVASIILDIQ